MLLNTDEQKEERKISLFRDILGNDVSGSSSMSYYVSGVAEGEWTVTVDGKEIGSFEASAEGGLLTFTAPAGAVVVSPAN